MPTYNVELSSKPVSSGEHAGLWQIFVRVSTRADGKQFHERTGTGVYIEKSEWVKGARYGKWVKGKPTLNTLIDNAVIAVKAKQGEAVDGPVQFFPFSENLLKDLRSQLKEGSYDFQKSTLAEFKEVAGPGLQFSHVNDLLINRYVSHCREKGNGDGTIMNKFSVLRRVLNAAGHSNRAFLFDKVKFKYKPKRKESLTADEVKMFENAKLTADYREVADIFLFCMYNWGMRCGDAIKMKVGDFRNGELSYNSRKTDHPFTINVVGKAVDIFAKYSKGKKPDEYLFKFMLRQYGATEHRKITDAISKIDRKLNVICGKIGVDKHITSHCARHTWARMMDTAKVDRRIIQRALGHQSLATTEKYLAELSYTDVDAENMKIFG